MVIDISYIGAAGAGLLSFLSPCVLPLVPAYLCYLSGMSIDELTHGNIDATSKKTGNQAGRRRVLWAALLFVAGFSTVFISFGATASAISGLLLTHKLWLGKIAGAVIIIFGLHLIGLFRLSFLNYEKRFNTTGRPASFVGAYVIGLAFAFGWTPCIGPVLATILSVAARQESLIQGTALLAVYAAGLGVPFIAAALAAGPFMRWMARFRRHIRKVEITTGGLLVATGMLFVMNSFETMSYWLLETFPIFSAIG